MDPKIDENYPKVDGIAYFADLKMKCQPFEQFGPPGDQLRNFIFLSKHCIVQLILDSLGVYKGINFQFPLKESSSLSLVNVQAFTGE